MHALAEELEAFAVRHSQIEVHCDWLGGPCRLGLELLLLPAHAWSRYAETAQPPMQSTTSTHLPRRGSGRPGEGRRCVCSLYTACHLELVHTSKHRYMSGTKLNVPMASAPSCASGQWHIPVQLGANTEAAKLAQRKPLHPGSSPHPYQFFCTQLGNGTCLFVGDDEAFIAEAADLAQRHLGCAVFSERAKYELPRHKQSMFNHLPLEERCKATLHLLKDLELLAHSDYFVGALRCWGSETPFTRSACV